MSTPSPRGPGARRGPSAPPSLPCERRFSWVAVDVLRRLIARLHLDWEALPPQARRTWWWALGLGILLVELLTLALVWCGKALTRAGALAWEDEVIRWMDGQPYLSFNLGLWLEGPANGFVLWFVVLYASGLAAWRRRPLIALTLLTGYTLMYLPIATGWMAWDRARPLLIAGGIGSPGGIFRSFPSGHSVQAVFAYGYLGYLWYRLCSRRAERAVVVALYLFVVAVVSVGRLRLGAHWPTDLLGGWLIGGAWLAAALVALRRAERARDADHARSAPDI